MARARPGDRLARPPRLARRVLWDGSKRMLRTTEGHEMNNGPATPESAIQLTGCTAGCYVFACRREYNLFRIVNRRLTAADDMIVQQ